MVADTDSESGAEASDVEDCFEERRRWWRSAEVKPQAATSGGLPTWGLSQEGTQIFVLLSVQQKVWKNEAAHIIKDSLPLSVLMFFTEIFHLLVEKTNIFYQQHMEPSCQLPDITLPDMMTFVALALQMGHALKDTLHDYWLRLRQLHHPFYDETMTRQNYTYIVFSAFSRQFT